MREMFLAERSARSEGLVSLARMPPWTTGCRVFTRPPSISGAPVTVPTSDTCGRKDKLKELSGEAELTK